MKINPKEIKMRYRLWREWLEKHGNRGLELRLKSLRGALGYGFKVSLKPRAAQKIKTGAQSAS